MFMLTTATLMFVGVAAAQDAAPEVVSRSLPVSVPALSVQGGSGSVTVRAVPGTTASRVTVTPTRWSELCSVEFGGDAAQAQVRVLEDGEVSPWRCRADVVIELAGTTAVDVSMGRARVSLEGSTAPVHVDLRAGRVEGNPADEITVTAQRADVHLWGLSAPALVDLGVGRTRLAYAAAMPGIVDASVGLGTVRVAFPYGTLIEDASDARVGWTRSAIPSRAGEPTRLQAKATVGTVRVRTDLEALSAQLSVAHN